MKNKLILYFTWGTMLLFHLSCKRKQEISPALMAALPVADYSSGDVSHVLINPDGSILIHTVQNIDSVADFNNYLENRFLLFDPGFRLVKTQTIKGKFLYEPMRDGNTIVFPGFHFASYAKPYAGVLLVNDHLSNDPGFTDCQQMLEDTVQKRLFPHRSIRIQISRFNNGDWCLATNFYTEITLDAQATPLYLNLGPDPEHPIKKWTRTGNQGTQQIAFQKVPNGIFFTEIFSAFLAGSNKGYTGILQENGSVQNNGYIEASLGLNNYASKCLVGQSGKIMFYSGTNAGSSILEFDPDGRFTGETPLPYPYSNREYFDNLTLLNNGTIVALCDSMDRVNFYTEMVFLDKDLKPFRSELFPFRRIIKNFIGGFDYLFADRALLKHPAGGYLLFLIRSSIISNRYNYVFIRLDDDFRPPA